MEIGTKIKVMRVAIYNHDTENTTYCPAEKESTKTVTKIHAENGVVEMVKFRGSDRWYGVHGEYLRSTDSRRPVKYLII